MVDEPEKLDWPWWGREAMLATTLLTLLLRAGAFCDVGPLPEPADFARPVIADDARTFASSGKRPHLG